MRPVARNEVLGLGEYEQIRERFRARVIEDKRARRVALGEHLSATFENRDTVMLQIQEMLRTERITSEAGIQHEIDTYNELIPAEHQLSITLFVEIPDRELRDRTLVELAGLEDAIALEVDGERYPFAGKRIGASHDRTTAVHYLKCSLPAEASERIRTRQAKLALVATHAHYAARTDLPAATAAKLADDLAP